MAIETTMSSTKLTGSDASAFLRQTGVRVEAMSEQKDAADKMSAASMQTYSTTSERAALRCALGDAAHLCDAMARDIESRHRPRKTLTKRGHELATIARMCGDAIWQMRDLIDVPTGEP